MRHGACLCGRTQSIALHTLRLAVTPRCGFGFAMRGALVAIRWRLERAGPRLHCHTTHAHRRGAVASWTMTTSTIRRHVVDAMETIAPLHWALTTWMEGCVGVCRLLLHPKSNPQHHLHNTHCGSSSARISSRLPSGQPSLVWAAADTHPAPTHGPLGDCSCCIQLQRLCGVHRGRRCQTLGARRRALTRLPPPARACEDAHMPPRL